MDNKNIVVVLNIDNGRIIKDVEIPLDITANELIAALNSSYKLGMNTEDISSCYLRSENPIALLKGTKTLFEFGLHHATVIYYKQRRNSDG